MISKQALEVNRPAQSKPKEETEEKEKVPKDIYDLYNRIDNEDDNIEEEKEVCKKRSLKL